VTNPDLILDAIRLYPGNVYLQREWMRAIEVVRATRRGWTLDTIIPMQPAAPLYRIPLCLRRVAA
jgi:hypothetical protein